MVMCIHTHVTLLPCVLKTEDMTVVTAITNIFIHIHPILYTTITYSMSLSTVGSRKGESDLPRAPSELSTIPIL